MRRSIRLEVGGAGDLRRPARAPSGRAGTALATLALQLTLQLALQVSLEAPAAAVGQTIPADVVRVLFLLERQRDDLGDLALAVSDPASRRYGRHRAVDEVAARYGGSPETIARVVAFLAGHGVASEVDVTGTFVAALLDPEQVTAIFGPDPKASPLVPDELSGAVTAVFGAFHSAAEVSPPFPIPLERGRPRESAEVWPDWSMASGTPAPCPASDPALCSNPFPNPGPPAAFRSFTPDQLRTAYGIASTGLTGRGRSAVVVEFDQRVARSDIDAYTDAFDLPRAPLHQVVLDDRGHPLPVGGEATLDVETIVAMAPGLDRLTLLTAPAHTDAQFLVYWLLVLSSALDASVTGGVLTDVISVSWGVACEAHPVKAEIFDATEAIFQTAAAIGVTVSVAAGDQGSTGCVPRTPPYEHAFLSLDYPGSSPWATAVGGTSFVLAPDDTILETRVWNDWSLQLDVALPHAGCDTPPCRPAPVWGGSGGQSIRFARPRWQRGSGVDPNAGRQVPDVAYLADIYPGTMMYWNGSFGPTGNGTSQASPIFASIALMLNEAAAAVGRPRLGFANPLLYRLARTSPEAFVDVVAGDNVLGDDDERFDVDCCHAGAGYDMASGWGSLLLDRAVAALGAGKVAVAPRARLPIAAGR